MNLYLIKRKDDADWDEWEAVVARHRTPELAVALHPGGPGFWEFAMTPVASYWHLGNLTVEMLAEGVGGEPGIVLDSFHAG